MTQDRPGYDDTPMIPGSSYRVHDKARPRPRVVAPGAKGLADLGIPPTPMDLILPTYLWRFRPAGQYEAIKESAKGLRGQE